MVVLAVLSFAVAGGVTMLVFPASLVGEEVVGFVDRFGSIIEASMLVSASGMGESGGI